MSTPLKQVPVAQTLDVDAVEQALAALWDEAASEPDNVDFAVMRARAANLMVFATSEASLQETQQTINELALTHPCRALVMVADFQGADADIEMFVSAFSQAERRSQKPELCCEEVTLVARGQYINELPSAATPLLVPDLPVFLWLQDLNRLDDQTVQSLTHAAERLVIDSVDSPCDPSHFQAITRLFSRQGREAIAVSDINWARLTSWRSLLANFYDVHEYQSSLNDLDSVTVDYVSPASNPTGMASQALLTAGWLGSRLNWTIDAKQTDSYLVRRPDGGAISLKLRRVERPAMRPGRLAKLELESRKNNATFTVQRAENGLHLETVATVEDRLCPGRTLPVRNRSTANLLSREMEILNNDTTYEAALQAAKELATDSHR